jgi:TRAP-type C4-dicarboxylate transport system permease small subunit
MDRLLRIAQHVTRAGAWFGGALLGLAVLAIAAEVLLRNLVGRSFGAVDELSGYALAIASSWAFAYALVHRAHIRIDTVYTLLAPRWRAAFDLVALAGLLLFFTVVLRHGWDMLARAYAIDQRAMTPLRTPLFYPQLFWYAGMAVLVMVAALLLLRAGQAFARGDTAAVARLAGARSAQEELDDELAGATARRDQGPGR